jgi:NADH:ubiquinone oxidoreductase subunit 3 (subunit A)
MTDFLLTPLAAFAVYILLVAGSSALGRVSSARSPQTRFKTTMYAGGEVHELQPAAPGYRHFFVVALFFAVLHLGVLMIGSSNLAPAVIPYLIGLILVLIALILG